MRADQLLVKRGVFDSRAKAQAAIAAGLVHAGGEVVKRPSQNLPENAPITAQAPHPWVSRGGVKLAAALDAFGYDPRGLACLDIGASTGGFTEVLLARGARHVDAVDVGHGQLHDSLRRDERVTSHEGTDIRTVAQALPERRWPFAVVDVSFISLKLVLPALAPLLDAQAKAIALVKPQFEVGRANVVKGIVKNDEVRMAALGEVVALAQTLGFIVDGPLPSPIAGGDGNIEFLIGLRRG